MEIFSAKLIKKKRIAERQSVILKLPDQDSNLDKQNQNLSYYHYTIGQCFIGEMVCKYRTFCDCLQKYFQNILIGGFIGTLFQKSVILPRMNRKFTLILFLLTAFLVSCAQVGPGNSVWGQGGPKIVLNTTDDLYRFLTFEDGRYPLVSAHRGGPTTGYPENALETFEYQRLKQPLIIEFDVNMSKDSVLVLMHDDKLDRTTTGTGLVSDYTFEELQRLFLKDNEGNVTTFRIPTLDEALQWGKGKVVFTVDVKRQVPYAKVVEAIERNQAKAFSVVITYNADQALAVHRLDPELMISASIGNSGDLLRLNDRDIPDNRLVAFVGTREVDKGMYELLHGHGIMCILGTMGNLDNQAKARGDEVYKGFIERGADILSTDRPEEAGKVLEAYRKEQKITSKYVR
jgi:glycerophosphoryl diester phosphodiesterase